MAIDNKLTAEDLARLATQYAPGLVNEVLAISKIESNMGKADGAYVPNASGSGAIGPMQILSKAVGGKYGNFEQYAEPGMTDPYNPVHSAIAGMKMFADLAQRKGIEGAVKSYIGDTGKPDAFGTTAPVYLQRFNAALNSIGQAAKYPEPGQVRAAYKAAGVNPDSQPPASDGSGLPANNTVPLDSQAMIAKTVSALSSAGALNQSAMDRFGLNPADPNSNYSQSGAFSQDQAALQREALSSLGHVYDSDKTIGERLKGMFWDSIGYQRQLNQSTAALAATNETLKNQQDRVGTQQKLNNEVTNAPGWNQATNTVVSNENRKIAQQQADTYKQQLLLQNDERLAQNQQRIDLKANGSADPAQDELWREAATKFGMKLPDGVLINEKNIDKLLGKKQATILKEFGAGGFGADPISAVTTASSRYADLPEATADSLKYATPIADHLQSKVSAAQASQHKKLGASYELMDPKGKDQLNARIAGQVMARELPALVSPANQALITGGYQLTAIEHTDLLRQLAAKGDKIMQTVVANSNNRNLSPVEIAASIAAASTPETAATNVTKYFDKAAAARNSSRAYETFKLPVTNRYYGGTGNKIVDLTDKKQVEAMLPQLQKLAASETKSAEARASFDILNNLAETGGPYP